MKVELVVNRQCIELGVRQSYTRCPIGLAARNLGFDGVTVNPCGIVFWHSGRKYRAILPKQARNFIAAFDEEIPVSPTIFELAAYEAA